MLFKTTFYVAIVIEKLILGTEKHVFWVKNCFSKLKISLCEHENSKFLQKHATVKLMGFWASP